jgi:hypothetical protein
MFSIVFFQSFYSSCGSSITLWLLISGDIRFPWIRFDVSESSVVRDAVLCGGMAKMFVATSKGLVIVYKAKCYQREELGQTQERHIMKVAHEVRSTFLKKTQELNSS